MSQCDVFPGIVETDFLESSVFIFFKGISIETFEEIMRYICVIK